jgi:hypothetical protein
LDRGLAYIVAKEGAGYGRAKADLARLAREGRYASDVYQRAVNSNAAASAGPLQGRLIALLETREADRLAAMLREAGAALVAPVRHMAQEHDRSERLRAGQRRTTIAAIGPVVAEPCLRLGSTGVS